MRKTNGIIQYIVIFTLVMSLVACEGQNNNQNEGQPVETTFENAENVFDSIPLRILINSYKSTDYGIENNDSQLFSRIHTLNLDAQISKECEEKFGFPIEFFSIKKGGPGQDHNDYRVFLESGEIADLIFPTKIIPVYDKHFFWMDEFVDNGYYKDLTPYLSTYCPDVYHYMQRYDYILKMVTRNDKIYAVYAGVPDVSSMVLQVRNDLLAEYKTQDIRNFDDLFAFMEAMNQEGEPDENNRILVRSYELLKYAMIKAGYYPLSTHDSFVPNDIVFKLDDPECKPYFIEDTDILDVFFEEFLPFLEKSYFKYRKKTAVTTVEDHAIYFDANIKLLDNMFTNTYFNTFLSENTDDHAMNRYSMFLFDTESTIVDSINSILLIPVPKTSTQPEKALSFVNWLFTDEKMADYLTFGTDQGQFPNYQFNDDGYPMYNQAGCSVYMFHNLIANFSNKHIPFQNKTFDRTDEYKQLAYTAVHPPLYRYMESKHSLERYTGYYSLLSEYDKPNRERGIYLMRVMDELFNDPESNITADEIKEELRYITDEQALLFLLEEKLQLIVK